MAFLNATLEEDGKIHMKVPYEDRFIAKQIPGYEWDKHTKTWAYPVRPEVVDHIRRYFPESKIDHSIQKAVNVMRKQEKEIRKIKDSDDAEIPGYMFKTKPYAHQRKAMRVALEAFGMFYGNGKPEGGAALLMEQGCGKTKTSIDIASFLFQRGHIRKALVVAPSSVVPVWPKEFSIHAPISFLAEILDGSSAKKSEKLKTMSYEVENLNIPKLFVAVVNYESAWRMDQDVLKKWVSGGLLICDESQRIKTPGAKQSKCMHKLGRHARFRLALTGTPITKNPLDFFSQYKMLDDSIFGRSFYRFRNRYAVMGGFENRQVIDYKNMNELVEKAHSIAFRVSKAEALDLPEEIHQEQYVELSPKTKSMYNQLRREMIVDLDGKDKVTANQVLTQMLRLSQITGGHVNDEEGKTHKVGNEKLKVLDENLQDLLDAGKKIVIFARFIAEIEEIRKLVDQHEVGYAMIRGDVPQAERGEVVDRFQNDEHCRVFIAQIQTAGLGLTLTAADTAIFYSMDFSLANHEQAKARIHRIGQKNKVTYIYLLARGTIDEKVFKTVKEKKNVADMVVDHWRDFLSGERSVGVAS